MSVIGWTCMACRSTVANPEQFCGYDQGCPRKMAAARDQHPAPTDNRAELEAALREAREEIIELRRYANNHGGMIDDEATVDYIDVVLAALSRLDDHPGDSA